MTEEDLKKTEELELQKLSPEEAKKRTAGKINIFIIKNNAYLEMAKLRAFMFYKEMKDKRKAKVNLFF